MALPFKVCISIHASAKEATHSPVLALCLLLFQSTPPRRRRHCPFITKSNININFNPRLREGGDNIFPKTISLIWISIHASAKEATKIGRSRQYPLSISIHASAKEATTYNLLKQAEKGISIHASAKEATSLNMNGFRRKKFQSTPPRRRRRNGISFTGKFFISIHASAKEATATYCDTSAIMYISSLNNFFVHFF